MCVCVCVCMCVSICLYVCMSLYMSAVCLYIYVCLYACLSVSVTVYLYFCLYVCLSVSVTIYLSVCPVITDTEHYTFTQQSPYLHPITTHPHWLTSTSRLTIYNLSASTGLPTSVVKIDIERIRQSTGCLYCNSL